MKKIILLAVLTIIGTPGALCAVYVPSVTDGGTNDYVCRQLTGNTTLYMEDTSLLPRVTAGSNGCTSVTTVGYTSGTADGGSASTNYKKTSCTQCSSGYRLTEYTEISTRAQDCEVTWHACTEIGTGSLPCEGLPCENMTSSTYQSYSSTSTNHNLTRCDVSRNICLYVCQKNYYARLTSVVGSPRSCSACPSVGNNNVKGFTTSYGADSITECYIPGNTNITDNTGTYRFTSNCYYTTGASVAG